MNDEFCGCCEGLEAITPIANANRPGLTALTYRVGTHATFLETMQARLSNNSQFPALAHLKTRAANDPSIALLDAWATVADVLTFYQERIANEGYLRTATERRSILELARLVGYTPRPGVSATVFPAFMMEIGYNTREAEVPAGTRIQSLPGPGEMPQFFETADKIAARTDWNEIKPRLTRPLVINKDNALLVENVYLKGIATNLRAGDPLLLTFRFETTDVNPSYPEPEPVLRKVATVEPQAVENFTKVTLQAEPLKDQSFLTAFKQVVEKYTNLDHLPEFCIDRTSQSFILVRDLLIDLANKTTASELLLKAIEYTTDVVSFGRVSTESAREKQKDERRAIRNALFLAVFKLKKYSVESIWFDQLLTELEQLVKAWYFSLKNNDRQITTATSTLLSSAVLSWANWLQKLNESSPQQMLDWYLVWSFSQIKYDLLILSSLDALPTLTRKNTVIAAKIGNYYHILIFDSTGEKVIDKGGEEFPLDPRLVKQLDDALNSSGPITDRQKKELINKIVSSVGYNSIKIPVKIEGFDSLSEIVTPLSQSPSLPPANRFQLNRNNHETFNSNSDLRPRLLETLDPRLGSTLYQTLASDDRVPVLSLKTPEAMRINAAPFGHNAPLKPVFKGLDGESDPNKVFTGNSIEWNIDPDDTNPKIVTLDALYEQIQVGSLITIIQDDNRTFHRVIDTRSISIAKYGLSGRVTRLFLDPIPQSNTENPAPEWITNKATKLSALRNISIYAQGEGLELAEEPLTQEPVCGDKIELGTIYEGLKAGRWLIVSGDRVDVPNTKASELVMLAGVQNVEPNPPGSKPYSRLTLSTKLAYVYKRDTVKIYGNVVKATHGETRTEVLGSGDGSQAFQQFLLRQPPLTYLSAPTPLGSTDTLEVRVNDVLWHETDSLSELQPIDRLYTLKTDDNAMTTVIFGNGEHGSRLPTGIENVRAVYRNGIGKVGNVKAEQINLLATRPLGLKGVINPLPASGGADRETRDHARENAPLAVMALDRLVSVQDYTDFARTFAGIGKASAQKLTDGTRQIVHVTIAGAEDIPIDASSDLYRNLKKSMRDFGDPNQPIRLVVRKLVLLLLAAKIRVLPDYQWEIVEPQIRAALLDNFGFDRRQLGQSIWLSDILSIIQQVRGVAYVDVDLFNGVSEDDIRTSSITSAERELLIDGTKVTIKFQQETNNLVVKLDGLPKEPPKHKVDADLTNIDPKTREIQPAQLAIFSPTVADTMILTELKP